MELNVEYRDGMVYTNLGDHSFACGRDVVFCYEHGHNPRYVGFDGCECEKMETGFRAEFWNVELMRIPMSELNPDSLAVSLFIGIRRFMEEHEGWGTLDLLAHERGYDVFQDEGDRDF